ncbi:MAG: flavodoxin domain-containing protein [Lactobacillales bacterium]|jgi:menaquinone-dependent protoporphyrinogen IX oxidase|nr:flavodoxin domain-containing protein [Lactobacillales bacterium]
MSTIIFHASEYGAGKQYATWVKENVPNATLLDSRLDAVVDFSAFDNIVMIGSFYWDGLHGAKFMKKHWQEIKDKHVIMATVGIANPESSDYTRIKKFAFPDEMIEKMEFYHLRGALDYSKISWSHRQFLKLMPIFYKKKQKRLLKEGKGLDKDAQEFLENYGGKISYVARENVEPIIQSVLEV